MNMLLLKIFANTKFQPIRTLLAGASLLSFIVQGVRYTRASNVTEERYAY